MKFLRSAAFPWLVAVLLFLPYFGVDHGGTWSKHLGLATVRGGDEPHYLVMMNSLLLDGDFDLRNNYASAARGSEEAGALRAGVFLDHHAAWFLDGRYVGWGNIYEVDRFDTDPQGHPAPRLRPRIYGVPGLTGRYDVSALPEYSSHPPGTALLLSAVLYPFRHTGALEHLALLCSALAVILSMLCFRAIVSTLTRDRLTVNLMTAAAFLATPVWHYGRTLYTEPFLLLCVTGAYALWLRRGSAWSAGALVAAGMLMKPPIALVLLPLFADIVLKRKWKDLALMCLFPFLSGLGYLWLNNMLWGGYFRSSAQFPFGLPWQKLPGMLFSPEHGLLLFAPVLALAAFGWSRMSWKKTPAAIMGLAGFGLWFAFLSVWQPDAETNGWAYGPRHLVPVIPLLALGMTGVWARAFGPERGRTAGRGLRWAAWALLALSLLINAAGALLYWKFWDDHPLWWVARWVGSRMF